MGGTVYRIAPGAMMTRDREAHYMSWKLEEDGPKPPPDYPDEEKHPSLQWLREQWEAGNTQKLEEMVELWEVFERLGKFGQFLKKSAIILGRILVWFAGIVGAWWVIVEGLARLNKGQP